MKKYIIEMKDLTPYGRALLVGGYWKDMELIQCKNCKKWKRNDGTFPDYDGKEWHGCSELDAFTSASGDSPVTPAGFYCGNAERKEE